MWAWGGGSTNTTVASGCSLSIIVTLDIDKIAQTFRLLILVLIVVMPTTTTAVVTVVIVVIIFTVAMVVTSSFIAIFSLDGFLTVVPVVVPGFLSTTVLQISTAWPAAPVIAIVLLVVVVVVVTVAVRLLLLLMVMMMLLLLLMCRMAVVLLLMVMLMILRIAISHSGIVCSVTAASCPRTSSTCATTATYQMVRNGICGIHWFPGATATTTTTGLKQQIIAAVDIRVMPLHLVKGLLLLLVLMDQLLLLLVQLLVEIIVVKMWVGT